MIASSSPPLASTEYDAIVIGSGFGGSMTALELVHAGWRVLMIERGGWVERGPQNWERDGAFIRTEHYASDAAFRVVPASRVTTERLCTCVGGPSVFYGGAAFRFRESDFRPEPEIVGTSGAEWPVGYEVLEPWYTMAEQLLRVSGDTSDPTEPPHSAPYPAAPAPLTATSRRIADAARALGLNPFRLPLAINTAAEHGGACVACNTCDAHACAVGAKGDLATRVIPTLLAQGMALATDTVVTRLVAERGRIAAVECVEKRGGRRVTYRASTIVLSAGALATPHLLLASGLQTVNPAGDMVGRHLMRHCNAMVYGVFAGRPNPANEHHKHIGIHDFYHGADAPDAPRGTLGNIQQLMAPPPGLLHHVLPDPIARAAAPGLQLLTGLLCIAEDQPQPGNRVTVDEREWDAYGLPGLVVEHRYSPRDLAARRFLARQAKRILRRAGAKIAFAWDVATFSHAVGTVRMGDDERSAPLDASCRYRGLDNLYITDGSVLPTAAGVNPSLTIAANALRVGHLLAQGARAPVARVQGVAAARADREAGA